MGSASVKIWVGVALKDGADERDFVRRMPREMFDWSEEFWESEERLGEFPDLFVDLVSDTGLDVFRSGEETVGIGIEILSCDWDDSPYKFPLPAVFQQKRIEAYNKVHSIFMEYGIYKNSIEIPKNVGLYISTDHS